MVRILTSWSLTSPSCWKILNWKLSKWRAITKRLQAQREALQKEYAKGGVEDLTFLKAIGAVSVMSAGNYIETAWGSQKYWGTRANFKPRDVLSSDQMLILYELHPLSLYQNWLRLRWRKLCVYVLRGGREPQCVLLPWPRPGQWCVPSHFWDQSLQQQGQHLSPRTCQHSNTHRWYQNLWLTVQ